MTDKELLERMYERDYFTGEIFRAVYGSEYRERFEAYKKDGVLPERVREACMKFLNGSRPLGEIAHS